jgi:hypothetical protein
MSNDGKYNSEAKEDSTPVAKEKISRYQHAVIR